METRSHCGIAELCVHFARFVAVYYLDVWRVKLRSTMLRWRYQETVWSVGRSVGGTVLLVMWTAQRCSDAATQQPLQLLVTFCLVTLHVWCKQRPTNRPSGWRYYEYCLHDTHTHTHTVSACQQLMLSLVRWRRCFGTVCRQKGHSACEILLQLST